MDKKEFKELIWTYGKACNAYAQFDTLIEAKENEYDIKLAHDVEEDELQVVESEIEEYQGKRDEYSAKKKELIPQIEKEIDNLFKQVQS